MEDFREVAGLPEAGCAVAFGRDAGRGSGADLRAVPGAGSGAGTGASIPTSMLDVDGKPAAGARGEALIGPGAAGGRVSSDNDSRGAFGLSSGRPADRGATLNAK